MFKSIGIAAFGGAIGLPVLAIVAGGVALVGTGVAVGYLVGHGTLSAATIGGLIAAA